MKTLLLSEKDILPLLSMSEVIEVVELAFKENALGKTQMPPKPYLFYSKYNGDLRTMSSYLEDLGVSAIKVVNVHPDNPLKYNLPTIMALIILIDPTNGVPIAIMGGAWITAMRTGAAGGIATKYLARYDSKVLGLIGAGVQSLTQVMAIKKVRNIEIVYVYDIIPEKAQKFAQDIQKRFKIQAIPVDNPQKAVEKVDILTTVTPSTEPIIKNEWVKKGLHINAIGADAPGKEELDPTILKRSKIIVDNWAQSSHGGEINVPLSKGVISKENIWGEIGEVIAGLKTGRLTSNEITVFDSTGLAIQDAATAWLVYKKALENNLGKTFEIGC